MMQLKTTQYGFEWGPATVDRAVSDDKEGWVLMLVKTKKHPHGLQIYVTGAGKVRVFDNGKEWLPPAED